MLAGVDLGGSKIEAILLGGDGTELLRTRCPTPAGDYPATLKAIAALHRQMETRAGRQLPLGLGTPGSLSPATGLMRNANSTCLNGHNLKADLEDLLNRPLRMANDADCFTLSEAVDGAGQGAPTAFGVIIGTGTGGGIAVHGHLLDGPNAIAGEWGHNPLPWPDRDELPGPGCWCGKQGCIETFLSGPGLAAEHQRRTGQALAGPDIVASAAEDDALARETLAIYEHRLARSLAGIINILDPHVIVLGGGLSGIERLYENVPRLWEPYVFSDVCTTRLLPPTHGDSSGVRGAAWLWR
ncbi:ROK family protein [Thiolapillus brandeum]|uniref:Fructokinase n=1 Tax=Thiolapillus brandeum TaxID=1076588 RepID=A0A7U6GH65_9GAMM|nr:ROK family protein [Thiolapillus brandeum]BAO43580.1 fructokinase [Thiolapillus brandeum]